MQKNIFSYFQEKSLQIAAPDKKFGVTWFHNQRQAIIDKYKLKG